MFSWQQSGRWLLGACQGAWVSPDRGFRPGTVCNVSRDGRAFGALVIAEAGLHRSVALILSLDNSAGINAGDLVTPRANPRI